MCDYSLESVASRPARVGDRLKTSGFKNTPSRGFADVNDPDVAVCLLPGTEVVFDRDAEYDGRLRFFGPAPVGASAARFRRVNENMNTHHHDALEFANGKLVLLTQLRVGQMATVLQLPAEKEASTAAPDAEKPLPSPQMSEIAELLA